MTRFEEEGLLFMKIKRKSRKDCIPTELSGLKVELVILTPEKGSNFTKLKIANSLKYHQIFVAL